MRWVSQAVISLVKREFCIAQVLAADEALVIAAFGCTESKRLLECDVL
jgi:hypothetical protein